MRKMSGIVQHTHVDGRQTEADGALWGVYVSGMDEWIAAASQDAAELHAHALNDMYVNRKDRSENDPRMWATPDLWPFTKAGFDEELAKHAAGAAREEGRTVDPLAPDVSRP